MKWLRQSVRSCTFLLQKFPIPDTGKREPVVAPAWRLCPQYGSASGSSALYAEPDPAGIRAAQMSWFSRAMDFMA